MKLKSLLLGSAAVMVAATGARAADAIVIEPEPVEYVRVCDAYGAGWWYIPGTETCIKFDGDVRVQYWVSETHDDSYYGITPSFDADGNLDGYFQTVDKIDQDETSYHDADYRARLNVRANNETEWGTLSTRVRFKASGGAGTDSVFNSQYFDYTGPHADIQSVNEGPGDADAVVDWAVISLAGFRVGYSDNYWTTAGGYGFYQARYDGPYGFSTGLYLDYTFAANGWTATIGVEDGNISGEAGAPDVYGGITYSGGGWYMAGIVYYDNSEAAAAWKGRINYDFGNGWQFGGWYAADNGDTDYVKGHEWGVTSIWQMTETLALFGGYGQYSDQYDGWDVIFDPRTVSYEDFDRSYDTYTVGLAWTPVNGLLIQPEWNKVVYEEPYNWIRVGRRPVQVDSGTFSLRIVRSF
jgi:Porin subfamily